MATTPPPGRKPDGLVRVIDLGDGRRAALVQPRADEPADAVLAKLGLAGESRPVIVVCGGADDMPQPRLQIARPVLGPAVARAAQSTGAAVLDGGTAAGVMALVGAERAADSSAISLLLGVAPAGTVALPGEPKDEHAQLDGNHTHFVLADSDEWGGETPLLMALADALAGDAAVVMVLAGGGTVSRREALEAVEHGWPLFVIEGTGGAADAIAALWRRHREPRPRLAARLLPARSRSAEPRPVARIGDPQLRRIVTAGDVRPVGGPDPGELARGLSWEIRDEVALKDAWVLFATYDRLAGALRRSFERFQAAILLLGVVATLLALIHDVVGGVGLHWVVVAAPIVISVLIALANHRAAGRRWVLLRAAAEATKSEIYRYRTRTGIYAEGPPTAPDGPGREVLLTRRLEAIEAALMQTDVSGGPLTPYDGPLPPAMYGAEAGDDGLSPLDAQRYVDMRLADQLSYYRGRIAGLDRRRGALQLLTIFAGGAGTVLAAAGLEIWIGLTTALSGAALAHLGYLQVDNTIIAYNRSATQLAGLVREFRATRAAQRSPAMLADLVARGEDVLSTELTGWVKQMTDAMQALQRQQSEAQSKAATDPVRSGADPTR